MFSDLTNDQKAGQLQRDFGIPHPDVQMAAALKRRSDREVTPFQLSTCVQRLAYLSRRGFDAEDGAIVMLMRGARIENLACAFGYRPKDVSEFVADINARLRKVNDLEPFYGEALRGLDLMRRA